MFNTVCVHSEKYIAKVNNQPNVIQMVDRPNTTPIGQDRKTRTSNEYIFQNLPFLYESRGGSL